MPTTAPRSHARTALVTGASSGIGYELAVCCARDGCDVVLVARQEARLHEIATQLHQRYDITAHVIVQDLAHAQAADELVTALRQRFLRIEILVNNAGVGTYGPFATSDLHAQTEMMQVNMITLTQLTRLLVPDMIARGEGKILNVASTAGFQPGPLMAVYYATKAYVISFSEALANELRGTGVSVTVLCPGPTRSAFQQRAGVAQTRLMSGRIMDAAAVARAGYDGLRQGQHLVIPGFRNRALALLVRLMPRAVVIAAVRYIQENRRTN